MDAATRRRPSETPGADDESDQRPISVAHGSVLFFASSVVGAAGFLVASLVLARLLGPSGRGTVAFVTVSALLTAHVVKLGLGQATIVLAGRRPEARAALLANLLAFSLVASLAGIAVVVGGLYLLDVAPAGFAAAATSRSWPRRSSPACLVDDNFLIGCGRLRAAAAISASGGWLCAGAVGIALAVGGLHVESAMIGWVAAHLVWAALLAASGCGPPERACRAFASSSSRCGSACARGSGASRSS